MFEKKTFVLNCAVCDTRKMTAESLQKYEQILINADTLLVNAASRAMLDQLPVVLNADCTLDLEDGDVDAKTVNGSYEINGNTAVNRRTVLTVNGNLKIAPGTEHVLENYVCISVNGNVRHPQSLAPYLTRLHINGYTVSIPDDCTELAPVYKVDKYFPLRAKTGRYFVEDKVILTDPQVNIRMLQEKQVQFVTGKLVAAECCAEDACLLVDETVKLVVVPEGWTYLPESAELDEALLEKCGTRLWIDGDLILRAASTPLLARIEQLHVEGTVELLQEQVELLRKLNAEYDKLSIIKGGKIIEDGVFVTIDKKVLEKDGGITVRNCATLRIKKDVDPELIMDNLCVINAGVVFCTPEQRGAVSVACRNVGLIRDGGEEDELSFDHPLELAKKMLNTKLINADHYVL